MHVTWKRLKITAYCMALGTILTGLCSGCGESDVKTLNAESFDSRDDYILEMIGEVITADYSDQITETIYLSEHEAETVSVSEAGVYEISGTGEEVRIKVEAEDSDEVVLILNNANWSNTSDCPLYIKSAGSTTICLAEDSQNSISDLRSIATTASDEDSGKDKSAAIYSKQPLSVIGNGKLDIEGLYNDGITSKTSVVLGSRELSIYAKDDGIVAKNDITIHAGLLNIDCDDDAIKATAKDGQLGNILVEGGLIEISTLVGHGFYAQNELTVDGGNIIISQCKEGLQGRIVTINDGHIEIEAEDDGINASDPQTENIDKEEAEDCKLTINGGLININAWGDGLDSNADIVISDGDITVSGSIDGSNSALDYATGCIMTGGHLYLSGHEAMAGVLDESSTVTMLVGRPNGTIPGGSQISLCAKADGEQLLSWTVPKDCTYIQIAAPEIDSEATYYFEYNREKIQATPSSSDNLRPNPPGKPGPPPRIP